MAIVHTNHRALSVVFKEGTELALDTTTDLHILLFGTFVAVPRHFTCYFIFRLDRRGYLFHFPLTYAPIFDMRAMILLATTQVVLSRKHSCQPSHIVVMYSVIALYHAS